MFCCSLPDTTIDLALWGSWSCEIPPSSKTPHKTFGKPHSTGAIGKFRGPKFHRFLPSATKLRRLCFYTCLSFCPRGRCAIPACIADGIPANLAVGGYLVLGGSAQGVPGPGGAWSQWDLLWGVSALEGSALGGLLRGVCSGGSAPGGCGDPPEADDYCCGRYASYLNAFLFFSYFDSLVFNFGKRGHSFFSGN